MNKLLKIISIMFIFVFFTTTVFATSLIDDVGPDPVVPEPVYIRSVTSDALDKGVLGIGDRITFTIRLSDPTRVTYITPEKYNGQELDWRTSDNITFTATYTVIENQNDQTVPLQLTGVSVSVSDGSVISFEDNINVNKTIDATRPTATISTKNIIKSTVESFILLSNISEVVSVKITYTDRINTISSNIDKTDLSNLKDGDIYITVRLKDMANNITEYTTILTKNTSVPVLDTKQIITKYNTNKITVTGIITAEPRETVSAKMQLSNSSLSMDSECVVTESEETIYKMSCEFDELKNGRYNATITIADNYGNEVVYNNTFFINTTQIHASFNHPNKTIYSTKFPRILGTLKLPEFATLSNTGVTLNLKGNPYATCGIRFSEENFSITCTPKPIPSMTAMSTNTPTFIDGVYDLQVIFTDDFRNTITLNQEIIIDTVAPVITLLGNSPVNLIVGNIYVDAGAIATDTRDGNITSNIVITSNVDTTTVGTYFVTYNVTDATGNSAVQVTRTVNVNAAPVIVGGGIRIYPATVLAPVDTPVETPIEEPAPVVEQPPAPENTDTDEEVLSPVVETPAPAPEAPVEEVVGPGGLTGFVGFVNSPGGVITMVGGALVIIGAIGYFFFLKPR